MIVYETSYAIFRKQTPGSSPLTQKPAQTQSKFPYLQEESKITAVVKQVCSFLQLVPVPSVLVLELRIL